MPTRCLACGGDAWAASYDVPETMYGTGDVHRYCECSTCGSLTLSEAVSDSGELYPDDYYSLTADPMDSIGSPLARLAVRALVRSALLGSGRVNRTAARRAPRREVRTLASILESIRASDVDWRDRPRVLDVGCGSGSLVYALSLGTAAYCVGVDPFGRSRTFPSGAQTRQCGLDDVQQGGWDLVMLHHSLEHVADPVATLSAARAALRPGGRVIVRMPTVTSDAWFEYRTEWAQLDAPRHSCVMSRTGVEAAVRRAGLAVVATRDDSTGFQFWGSEQIRLGIALEDSRSLLHAHRSDLFDRRTLGRWESSARSLNRRNRGDQSCWILVPVPDRGTEADEGDVR